ncbi:hypothetical protein AAVH_30392 [Aphelenchoides avenae]|nr:hypothetical protein AAVH_30392 [Aphelenchus avenae]
MPEATSPKATDRQLEDEEVVGELLNRLEIQCRPLSVYRVGKQFTDPKGHKRPRFTFIEFPNRSFALEALRLKHRLRQKTEPPMSKEERAKAYEDHPGRPRTILREPKSNHDISGYRADRTVVHSKKLAVREFLVH